MRHLDFITTMVSTFLGSINSTGYRKCPRVWNKKNAAQTVVLQRWRRSRASIGQKTPKNKTQANIVKEMSVTFFLHIIYYWTILIQIITFPSSVFLIRVLFWKRDVERFICFFTSRAPRGSFKRTGCHVGDGAFIRSLESSSMAHEATNEIHTELPLGFSPDSFRGRRPALMSLLTGWLWPIRCKQQLLWGGSIKVNYDV